MELWLSSGGALVEVWCLLSLVRLDRRAAFHCP